ncbi:DUF1636 domain-containing protein [Ruegeria sp. EL01]|jgi:predicted metal-binding protein|uniref:DUF1636 family protein n=1 Tax=Ruegeria sp. EL01 TaxID=2107578 RepID=UPI000EA81FBE|nr:DUF1636 domain-containing protein [Ruegeria sp. EL01]
MRDVTETTPVELLVCTTCRRGLPIEDDAQRPGTLLHKALEQAELPDGVKLKPVECLSNCNQGCSIVLRGGPTRWTFVYENLNEDNDVEIIVEGATKYLAAEDGLVKWRERPEHFRKNCAARIPPIGALE